MQETNRDNTSIVYYRANNDVIDDVVKELENDVDGIISVCNTWNSLIAELNSDHNQPIILLDLETCTDDTLNISEIIDMTSTLYKCVYKSQKAPIGVVISQPCSPTLIKELHKTDILGLVPCPTTFGYEHTKIALLKLIELKTHWPKLVIESDIEKEIITKSGIFLTDRQQQVLSLVCNRGLSNKKIAGILKISEHTVKIHVSAILKQYGVRNRTQLALAANLALNP